MSAKPPSWIFVLTLTLLALLAIGAALEIGYRMNIGSQSNQRSASPPYGAERGISDDILKEVALLDQKCGVPPKLIRSSDILAMTKMQIALEECAGHVLAIRQKLVSRFAVELINIRGSGCASDRWEVSEEYQTVLLMVAAKMKGPIDLLATLFRGDYLGPNQAGDLLGQIHEAAKKAITSAADIAVTTGQEAIKLGCSDVADKQFRHVLVAYSQPSQDYLEGHRRKAQLAIDDLRGRRR